MGATLTVEEVREIVSDSDLPFGHLCEMMKDDYGVLIDPNQNPGVFPEGSAEREQAVNTLAEMIHESLSKVSSERAEASKDAKADKKEKRRQDKKKKTAVPVKDPETGKDLEIPEMSRTKYIELHLKNAGSEGMTSKSLMKEVDEAYHYTLLGRTPRTRVLKTLRTLADKGQVVKKDTGEFVWISE